jgi:hypothetical protein
MPMAATSEERSILTSPAGRPLAAQDWRSSFTPAVTLAKASNPVLVTISFHPCQDRQS